MVPTIVTGQHEHSFDPPHNRHHRPEFDLVLLVPKLLDAINSCRFSPQPRHTKHRFWASAIPIKITTDNRVIFFILHPIPRYLNYI